MQSVAYCPNILFSTCSFWALFVDGTGKIGHQYIILVTNDQCDFYIIVINVFYLWVDGSDGIMRGGRPIARFIEVLSVQGKRNYRREYFF